MSNLIKKFNVTINGGNTATYEVGADAKNVQFSDKATSPFKKEFVENNNQNIDVPKEIVSKAENRIYGNAYIKNNDWDDIPGTPGFGPVDDIQTDRTNEGAGALTITYGFNSLAKGHHSTAIGFDCEANGWASHAEGWKATTAQGTNYSHAEGAKTEANHNAAHAEGDAAKAYGYGSHAEGRGTYVYGVGSHVEGMASNIGFADKVAWQNNNVLHGFDMTNDASNNDVDVELTYPKQVINGQLSHAEGLDNTIYGACCHAEGMYNTIHSVYASTAMGEANSIYSSASVAMGYKNTLNSGSNNSLILGNNNVNPGYPNALFLGQYCKMGAAEGPAPALVIGSGDKNTPSNLMTIRHPQAGIANPTNRGDLWGEHLNAHFGTVSQILYDKADVTKGAWRSNIRPLLTIINPTISNTNSHSDIFHSVSFDLRDTNYDWKADPYVVLKNGGGINNGLTLNTGHYFITGAVITFYMHGNGYVYGSGCVNSIAASFDDPGIASITVPREMLYSSGSSGNVWQYHGYINVVFYGYTW